MSLVRDDPLHPDPAFAQLYAALPDAIDLRPWLDLAQLATRRLLYLGIGTGRIAVPLQAAGIDIVGVDSHPAMLDRLRARAPGMRLIQSRIETLSLDERFDLVIAPSNVLYLVDRLRGAARHLGDNGLLAIELANPHWLRSGGGGGVRVLAFDSNEARLDIDYRLPDGGIITQRADVALVWPEEVENWLSAGAGLKLQRMF
ncbi:MAG TPA: class I SAM-dependent methyltransferase, partial [Candidatus Dormibacteraeota bacterium]|nr:class I SAM-dependent methyltransferase [Candidatus Dormibacteraeota bacterium]